MALIAQPLHTATTCGLRAITHTKYLLHTCLNSPFCLCFKGLQKWKDEIRHNVNTFSCVPSRFRSTIPRSVAVRARLNSVTWAAAHRDPISRALDDSPQVRQHATETVKEKNWNHPFIKDVFKRQTREKLIGKKKAATSKTATRTLFRSFCHKT